MDAVRHLGLRRDAATHHLGRCRAATHPPRGRGAAQNDRRTPGHHARVLVGPCHLVARRVAPLRGRRASRMDAGPRGRHRGRRRDAVRLDRRRGADRPDHHAARRDANRLDHHVAPRTDGSPRGRQPGHRTMNGLRCGRLCVLHRGVTHRDRNRARRTSAAHPDHRVAHRGDGNHLDRPGAHRRDANRSDLHRDVRHGRRPDLHKDAARHGRTRLREEVARRGQGLAGRDLRSCDVPGPARRSFRQRGRRARRPGDGRPGSGCRPPGRLAGSRNPRPGVRVAPRSHCRHDDPRRNVCRRRRSRGRRRSEGLDRRSGGRPRERPADTRRRASVRLRGPPPLRSDAGARSLVPRSCCQSLHKCDGFGSWPQNRRQQGWVKWLVPTPVWGGHQKVCPAVSYSPTRSLVQYHRR